MRSIIITVGTIIANKLEPLTTIEWVVLGILGVAAIFGDFLSTDDTIKIIKAKRK